MFYGFKDSKCYHLLQRITSAICTMCILFNLFPMSIFNAYAAEGGESSTITKNTISADGEIQLMDGWFLEKITNDVTSSGSYADDYDTGFYNKINSEYENGYNSEDTALKIGTAKQLAAFSKYVNDGNDFSSKYVKLVDNIDLNLNENFSGIQYDKDEDNANKKLTVKVFGSVSHSWNPIGTDKTYFGGTFLGNNHTIKNMLADGGLFKTVGEKSVIKGVNVKQSMVSVSTTGDVYAGGIAGTNNGTISNCTNSGAVSSSSSSSDGANTNAYAGGIAGTNKGKINNCTNSGAISSLSSSSNSGINANANTYAGGIREIMMEEQ